MSRLLVLTLSLVLLCGCLQRPTPVAKPTPKRLQPAPTPTPIDNGSNNSTFHLTADGDFVSNLHKYFGDTNTVTISKSLTITQPGMSLTIPNNCAITWTLTDAGGTFDFAGVKPLITVKEYGINFHPMLDQIVLKAPDQGTAVMSDLDQTIRRNFTLKWESKSSVSDVPTEKPINSPPKPSESLTPQSDTVTARLPAMYLFGQPDKSKPDYCVPCKRAVDEIEAYRLKHGLPFELVLNPVGIKDTGEAHPFFRWPLKDKWMPEDKSGWSLTGWYGVKHLIESFEKTRAKPKVARTRVTGRCQIGFGSEWVENKLGYTTVHHLIFDHGVSYEDIRPYANDRHALNRIHGWCHLREMSL